MRPIHRALTLALALSVGLGASTTASAGDPELGRVEPRGAAPGETVLVTFHGERLHDAAAVHVEQPGLAFGAVEVVDAKQVRAEMTVAPDCPLGEHLLRLVTRSGVSAVRAIRIGPFPSVDEVEPNDEPRSAHPLDPADGPRTVAGALDPQDVDHFAFELAAGERLAAEVEAMRLGTAMFDPRLELLDEDGRRLALVDDTPLLGPDAWLVFRAPRAMRVVLRLRDAAWRGGGLYAYRLHVGDFPRPCVVYPAGGRPREEAALTFRGATPDEDHERTLTLPGRAPFPFGLFLEAGGATSPSWTPFRLSGHANLLEAEPNDDPAGADEAPALPCALNGVLERPGDADWFRVPLTAGTEVRFNAMGRFVGSPVDTVLTLLGEDGEVLSEVDDAGGPDARIDLGVQKDAVVTVGVRDQRGRGGRTFVYRVEVTELRPGLSLAIPRFGRDSQARQALAVPRGGRVATAIRVSRGRFDGPVTFEARGLPEGVTLAAPPIDADERSGVLVFEAAPDAPLGTASVDLLGRHPKAADGPAVTGRFRNAPELVTFGPNRSVHHRTRVDRLTLAVVEPAPFTMTLEAPPTALLRGGRVDLTVRVAREDGFDGPITVRSLWLPAGTSSRPTVRVEPGAETASLRVDAKDDARLGAFEVALLGEADRGGTTFQATSHVTLTVAEPYLTGTCAMAAVARGGTGAVVCTLAPGRPFVGTATVHLQNLPPGVTADPREVAAGAAEVVFPIAASAKARLGLARNLFVELALPTDGGPVRWRTATGGRLRVDAAAPVTRSAGEADDAPRKSRLEQLRDAARRRAEERRGAVAGDGSPGGGAGGSE